MDLMYRGGTGGVGSVEVPERENCHPQDLSFLSVIHRVSNFIHPVARFSLASGNRLRPRLRRPSVRPSVRHFDKRGSRMCEVTYRHILGEGREVKEGS